MMIDSKAFLIGEYIITKTEKESLKRMATLYNEPYIFLGISEDVSGRTGIDAMCPDTMEEFQEFETALKDKILQFEVGLTNFPGSFNC